MYSKSKFNIVWEDSSDDDIEYTQPTYSIGWKENLQFTDIFDIVISVHTLEQWKSYQQIKKHWKELGYSVRRIPLLDKNMYIQHYRNKNSILAKEQIYKMATLSHILKICLDKNLHSVLIMFKPYTFKVELKNFPKIIGF